MTIITASTPNLWTNLISLNYDYNTSFLGHDLGGCIAIGYVAGSAYYAGLNSNDILRIFQIPVLFNSGGVPNDNTSFIIGTYDLGYVYTGSIPDPNSPSHNFNNILGGNINHNGNITLILNRNEDSPDGTGNVPAFLCWVQLQFNKDGSRTLSSVETIDMTAAFGINRSLIEHTRAHDSGGGWSTGLLLGTSITYNDTNTHYIVSVPKRDGHIHVLDVIFGSSSAWVNGELGTVDCSSTGWGWDYLCSTINYASGVVTVGVFDVRNQNFYLSSNHRRQFSAPIKVDTKHNVEFMNVQSLPNGSYVLASTGYAIDVSGFFRLVTAIIGLFLKLRQPSVQSISQALKLRAELVVTAQYKERFG